MKDCEITTLNKNTGNPDVNALLTFSGEQDCTAFATVCAAMEDKWQEESGGSRELSVRAVGDRIIIGYKNILKV